MFGYDPKMGADTYQTVRGGVAYDHPHKGETFILIVHQSINTPHLDHHLIFPIQCSMNDVLIDECTKYLTCNTTYYSIAFFVQYGYFMLKENLVCDTDIYIWAS